ncbi:MAG: isoprenylcysteine carboxylmethyltransferase family protein [Bacteroides sp.]|nr:isoprenylcysteine carboxylmethyltransferase family protein [Bacteroides sp.]
MRKTSLDKYGKKYVIASVFLVIVQMGIVFASAGNTGLPRAWIFAAVNLIYSMLAILVFYKINPNLLNQRGKNHENAVKWDVILVKINNLNMIFLLPLIVGLDLRFDFLPLNELWQIPGYLLFIFSNVLVLGSMIANNHFEAHVRIQSERAHVVVKSWPYNLVRHPGYFGVILWLFAFPLIIGSFAGIIFSAFISSGFIIRTRLEDNFLSKNLKGYSDYKKEVHDRIFPGIW